MSKLAYPPVLNLASLLSGVSILTGWYCRCSPCKIGFLLPAYDNMARESGVEATEDKPGRSKPSCIYQDTNSEEHLQNEIDTWRKAVRTNVLKVSKEPNVLLYHPLPSLPPPVSCQGLFEVSFLPGPHPHLGTCHGSSSFLYLFFVKLWASCLEG